MHFLQFWKKIQNAIDVQTNTNKLVVMTAKQILKGCSMLIQIFHFFNSINSARSIFETFWTNFRGHHVCHGMHSRKHTHLYNTPINTVWLSSNTTKVTHLLSCTLTMFSHHDTSKCSQFSSGHTACKSHLCCYAISKFTNLVLIKRRPYSSSEIKLIVHYNLPIHGPQPLSKNFTVVAQVIIVATSF